MSDVPLVLLLLSLFVIDAFICSIKLDCHPFKLIFLIFELLLKPLLFIFEDNDMLIGQSVLFF
jgi:hypothetical protein